MTTKRIIIGFPSTTEGGGAYGERWNEQKLKAQLVHGKSSIQSGCSLAFYACSDKTFWIQQAYERGYSVVATHPLCLEGAMYSEVQRFMERRQEVDILHEYVDPTVNFSEYVEGVGGLIYCEAQVYCGNEVGLMQSMLEWIYLFRMHLGPIDEIFCRSRNLKGTSEDADCYVVHLKLANGLESHWFFSALGNNPKAHFSFYGRLGVNTLDVEMPAEGVVHRIEHRSLIRTYKIFQWILQAARFERSVSYREAVR